MWQPDAILLGPGGIKGFMQLGFLLYMEDKGILRDIKAYAGVSIGAIISLLITLGYSIYEIVDIASQTEILAGLDNFKMGDILRGQGIIPHDMIKNKLEELAKAKFGKVFTLMELYKATGVELYITSSALHHKDPYPVYMSYKTEPDISCVDAVLLSMNIPFVFQKLYYKGQKNIDGAVCDPYPIHLIDNGVDKILGLYLSSKFNEKDDNVITYVRQVMYASMVQLRRMRIEQASSMCRHVGLYSNNYDSVGFMTSSDDKVEMITEGYETAIRFYEKEAGPLVVLPENIDSIEEVPYSKGS